MVNTMIGTVHSNNSTYQRVEVYHSDEPNVPNHLRTHYLNRIQRAKDTVPGDKVLLTYRKFGGGGLWFATFIE